MTVSPKSDSHVRRVIEMLEADPRRSREVDGEVHGLLFPNWAHTGGGIMVNSATGTRKNSAEFTGSVDASLVLIDEPDQVDIWRDPESRLWHVRFSRRNDPHANGYAKGDALAATVTLAKFRQKLAKMTGGA